LPSEAGLLSGTFARGAVAEQVSDRAWVQAMLDVEAALAEACRDEGLIPADATREIVDACRDGARQLDLDTLARHSAQNATPVVGLVAALRERVGPAAAPHVHHGATSQDIVDTGLMLLARRALRPLAADARAAVSAAASLAEAHRATPMLARTLLQPARPTTFGLRAAGWMTGIAEATAHLAEVTDHELAVQMGGPVGARAPTVAARVAARLGLVDPLMPWDAIRVRPARLATALGTLSGVLGKVARDVTLLAQGEVGEVREGEPDAAHPRGMSSAMDHKRNPVAAVSVLACVKRTPGLVAGLLAAMEQEHERAAGAWQAEWGGLTDLLVLTGSAAAWTRDLLEHLEVQPERMAANLARLGPPEAGVDPGAAELIDRALSAHRR
jgi:3-carboxy-cis,cis-muconate cycloisomerase